MTANAPIESPCILVCALDLTRGLCTGCGRSRQQIALWTRYSDGERSAIMDTLPETLAKLLGESG